jgi:hypothetical protein
LRGFSKRTDLVSHTRTFVILFLELWNFLAAESESSISAGGIKRFRNYPFSRMAIFLTGVLGREVIISARKAELPRRATINFVGQPLQK